MGCKNVSDETNKKRIIDTNPLEPEKTELKKSHIKVESTIKINNDNIIENIKIAIPLKDNSKWESSYPKETKIQTIIDDFKAQNPSLSNMFEPNQQIIWKYNHKELNLEAPLDTIIKEAIADNPTNEDNKIAILDISYEIINNNNNVEPSAPIAIEKEETNNNNNNNSNVDNNSNSHTHNNKVDEAPQTNSNNDTTTIKQVQYVNSVLYGIPIQNPFEVFIFSTKTGCFTILTTNQSEIEKVNLNKYSRLSSYCNANDCLFISGGEDITSNTLLNDFWIVDLNKGSIEQIQNTIVSKKLHSMIYIQHNNTLYIVGGSDKSTYIYDIVTKTFQQANDLNTTRIEPALLVINNYLYAFSLLNEQGNEITFERTNHTSISPWELLTPRITTVEGTLQYKQKLFGVAYGLDSNYIFIGGNIDYMNAIVNDNDNSNSNKQMCLCYNDNDNTLSYSDSVEYSEFDFGEKNFYKYKDNIDFIIPSFNRKCPVVILYDKTKQEVKSVPFLTKLKITDPSMLGQSRMLSYSALPKFKTRQYNFNMPKPVVLQSVSKEDNINNNNTKLLLEQVIKEEPEEHEEQEKEGKHEQIQTKILSDIDINANIPNIPSNSNSNKLNLGDVYINTKNCNELYTTGKLKKIEMKNAGMFFKSSVIKGNQNSGIQQSLIPVVVSKSNLPVKSVIKLSTNFNKKKDNTALTEGNGVHVVDDASSVKHIE